MNVSHSIEIQIIEQYSKYIGSVKDRQKAGKLTMSKGESIKDIRRILNTTADAKSVRLEIYNKGNTLFFWIT